MEDCLALFSSSTKKFISRLRESPPDWSSLLSLSKHGVKSSSIDKDSGKTVLELLVENVIDQEQVPREKLSRIAKNIIRSGGDVNVAIGPKEETALQLAAKADCPELVEALLDAGASPDSSSSGGITALHMAIDNGTVAVSKLLIEKGADVNAEDETGNTPLHYAAMEPGRSSLIDLLIKNGAIVYARNAASQTPRDIADKKGFKGYVWKLEAALEEHRGLREVNWECPECGSPMERPSHEKVRWYVSIGMWEHMGFTCGNCGKVTGALELDGER
jgi:ankyrin repeat protein